MKKRDIILILAILLISLTGWAFAMPKGNGATVDVYIGEALYGSYDLDKDQTVSVVNSGIVNVIEIADRRARMKEATCPNRICVECGWIDKSGESICCAPSKVLMIIRSDDGGYDAVTK